MDKLYVKDGRITDGAGRHVLLSGLNLVCKQKDAGYAAKCDESLFEWLAQQGHNVVRLGLIWDGVEPEPGKYDDDYLARIRRQAEWAGKHGIYVFLDMHQDLYGDRFGDGAPEWATLTDGLPHEQGALWSDAYLSSRAVCRAFDHFWLDTPAADGIGLQSHYAAMWRHVADFFRGCDSVIGYDIMNEPYPGTAGQEIFGTILETFARENAMEDSSSAVGEWFEESSRGELLSLLNDMALYAKVTKSAEPASQRFEREFLTPFYEKIGGTLRGVNPDALLILESSYFSNMGVESGLGSVLGGDGTVYSPHGYDLVVDTALYGRYHQPRVDFIFEKHRRVQRRLGQPVLVGEWGGFPSEPITKELTEALLRLFERNLWSHTYWCWQDGFCDMPCARALCRAYPRRTAGTLLNYSYEPATERLEIEYLPTGGVSELYHPRAAHYSRGDLRVEQEGLKSIRAEPIGSNGAGLLFIESIPGNQTVRLIIG